MQARSAILVTVSVAVVCPHCGADQPDPASGSLFWTPDQLKGAALRQCVACDAPIRLRFTKTAKLEA